MATLNVIRRRAPREQLSICEIARGTGLSSNTIRKYLRNDTRCLQYKPRINPNRLATFAENLTGWIRTESSKSRKQQRTIKQMHFDLPMQG